MRLVLLTAAALVLPAGIALADAPPTPEESAKIMAVLKAEGCADPREVERETDNGRLEGFEVEDAKCADGVYDFELDVNFKIIERDRDS